MNAMLALNRRENATSEGGRRGRQWTPRLIVLGLLMTSFAWAVIIPLSLVAPPSTPLAALAIAGMCVLGGALVVASWVAASPAPSLTARLWTVVLLVAVALVLWLPLYAWAERGEEPWAWLAGFVIAASALVAWQAGIVTAVVLGVAAVIGGVAFDGSILANVLTSFGCAAVVWLMCQVMVWLLRLLREAQAGREAQAELAIADERLRVSRELHDVLGHRLGIIALKAELAADLSTRDPARSAAESDGIRTLAAETLTEARRAVHGETVTNLAAQLDAAALVLDSAGIERTIETDTETITRMPDMLARLLATVVREAVTNILRHSDAGRVSITVADAASPAMLAVVNDGVRDSTGGEPSSGTGLASLSARCAATGMRLVTGRDAEGRFELRVEASSDRNESL